MIFIIGGAYQGKTAFAISLWKRRNQKEPVISEQPARGTDILSNLHRYIKKQMQECPEQEGILPEKKLLKKILAFAAGKPDSIILMNELGCGVVPIDPSDRRYRELCGRISCVLARLSDQTYKVSCGIGTLLASHDFLTAALLRHGKTPGNEKKRYIGRTDESLSENGKKEIRAAAGKYRALLQPEILLSSPMKRCLETGALLFPALSPRILPELKETDFGKLEGKNWEELNRDTGLAPLWQAWLNSNGTLPFPGGESREAVTERTTHGFIRSVTELFHENRRNAAFIVHGGSIMALLSSLVPKNYFHRQQDFYSWQVTNGDGYLLLLDREQWLCGQYCAYPLGRLSELADDL